MLSAIEMNAITTAAVGRFCGTRPAASLLRRSNQLATFARHQSIVAAASTLSYSAPIISRPTSAHTATVVFLHGLGDTGAGWSAIAEEFRSDLSHVKFIFPNAPLRPITLNWGQKMPGWYDISTLEDINQAEDEEGLNETKRYVEHLVQAEVTAGIPSHRVIVAGFSQGGAAALMMLRSSLQLAGVVGLSTYLPLRDRQPVVSEANQGTPVLMCHGDADPVVGYEYGRQSYEQLRKLGINTEFITYRGMGHSACPPEMQDILEFLKTNLK